MAHSPAIGTSAAALSFTFSTQTLRVLMIDGEPWFVASDVCAAVGIKNHRDSVERLDADEKGVASTDTLGGQQEMLIVNESGLNAIILRCRDAMTPGTPAHKYRKWVTSEVLPSIRKTGQYTAPAQPAPQSQAEKLSTSDMHNIKRVIWLACAHMRFDSAWTQAIWFYLRQALALPYPAPMTVEHLPTIATELQRIVNATEQVNDLVVRIEREAAKRIFRKGECADTVVAELEAMAEKRVTALSTDLHSQALPTWMQTDMQALQLRKPSDYHGHNDRAETPMFSGEAA